MDRTQPIAVQDENRNFSTSEQTADQSEDELDRLIDESIYKDEGTLEEWQVLTHIFKAFVGTGILGLPSAVMHGGIVVCHNHFPRAVYLFLIVRITMANLVILINRKRETALGTIGWAGPIVLFVLGLACVYNIKLLVDTAKNIREGLGLTRISYSGVAEHLCNAYGKKAGTFAKVLTDFLLCTLQLGFCCVYVVFVSHNIQVVAGILDVRIWMMVLFPFLLIPSLVTDIKRLAYLTTIGNVIVLVGLGVIYHYLFEHIMDPSKLPQYNGFINTCVSFGQVVYAFEGIAVILPTENKLKRRESFDWLLKIAGALVIILYSSMGIFGYLTFGAETLGSITLNLPQTKLYQILQIFFAVMVYFTYPLQLLVSVEIIKWYTQEEGASKAHLFRNEILIRSILVVSTCILAICIPQLDNFMALVGSISGVAVGLILPPIFHLICYWNQGISRLQIAVNVIIIIMGVFTGVTGTCSTIYSIFHRFVNYPESTKFLVQ